MEEAIRKGEERERERIIRELEDAGVTIPPMMVETELGKRSADAH